MKIRTVALKKAVQWFEALPQREKLLVCVMAAAIAVACAYVLYDEAATALAAQQQLIEKRLHDLDDLGQALERYQRLSSRMSEIELIYADSHATASQVYTQLDGIVRESIGEQSYDLKRSPTTSSLGENAEQQDFTLKIPALSLEQLVKLLYRLEQGGGGVVLSKVDVTKGAQPGQFSASLEVSAIRKKEG
jgi:type II secretory pathway component PulM